MGRPKKSVPAPAEIEPEEESQEVPEEEPEVEEEDKSPVAAGTGKPISGAEAVRRAMADGKDSPGDIADYAFEQFGLTIPKTMVSSYKSQEKARQAKKAGGDAAPKAEPAKRGPKPKPPLVENYVAPPEKPKAAGETDILLALEGVKDLVSQYGAERVKKMVDLLS